MPTADSYALTLAEVPGRKDLSIRVHLIGPGADPTHVWRLFRLTAQRVEAYIWQPVVGSVVRPHPERTELVVATNRKPTRKGVHEGIVLHARFIGEHARMSNARRQRVEAAMAAIPTPTVAATSGEFNPEPSPVPAVPTDSFGKVSVQTPLAREMDFVLAPGESWSVTAPPGYQALVMVAFTQIEDAR